MSENTNEVKVSKFFVEPFGETNETLFREIVDDTSGNGEFRQLKDVEGNGHNVVELTVEQFCKLLRHKQQRCHQFHVFIETDGGLLQRIQVIIEDEATHRTFDAILQDISAIMPQVTLQDMPELLSRSKIQPVQGRSPHWFGSPAWKQNRRPRHTPGYIRRRFSRGSHRP
ncbi:MAG: hypothetical protein AAB381_01745 [Patescibacteria group bacterium]